METLTSSFILAALFSYLSTYVVHAASSSSIAAAEPADPTTPVYSDDVTWLTAYLTIHSLSKNSYVYMYLFWFAIAAISLALSITNWTNVSSGALGAYWQRWALRRRTWRKKHAIKKAEAEAKRKGLPLSSAHRQPVALPSNAQLLTASMLIIAVILICFVGPDYINPDLSFFSFSSSSTSSKRAIINDSTMNAHIAHYNINKSFWTAAARTGGVAFALYPLVITLALKSVPFALFAIPGLVGFSHDKMIRLHRYVGRLVWFVTFLHVIFWVVQVLKDKRVGTGEIVFMYVWEYPKFRYAWVAFLSMTILMIFTFDSIRNPHYELFYAVHVICTPVCIIFSALHHPQRQLWTWCAAALALWIGERTWRGIWWVYVNGIFAGASARTGVRNTNVTAAVQPYTYDTPSAHRPAPSNGSTTTLTDPGRGSMDNSSLKKGFGEEWEMSPLRTPMPRRPQSGYESFGDRMSVLSRDSRYSADVDWNNSSMGMRIVDSASPAQRPTPTPAELLELARLPTNGSTLGITLGIPLHIQTVAATPPLHSPAYPPTAYAHTTQSAYQSPGAGPGPSSHAAARWQPQPLSKAARACPAYAPPPGFAHVKLLPGRTMRLRLVTPGYQTWAPGQHFLLGLPAVSRFTTHPFSVASVCDEQAALRSEKSACGAERGGFVQIEAGRELVLLIRAKKGWTKRLWDLVSSLQRRGQALPPGEALPAGCVPPPPGVPGIILRALIDGPFGSAGQTKWGRYASVLIVTGGSGVCFGLSVLEFVCLCLAGRDGRYLGGQPGGWGIGKKGAWITQRVRFVWLVREYAHIQWCASSLRRCLDVVPTDALEISIFVTNFRPPKEVQPPGALGNPGADDGMLQPPAPLFAGKAGRRSSLSDDPEASDVSVDSIVDMYYTGLENGGHGTDAIELGHETHVLDYTNFDGEDDTPLLGERRLSRKIIKESRQRRARSRLVSKAKAAKMGLEERAAAAHTASPSDDEHDRHGVGTTKRFSTLSAEPLLASAASPISAVSPSSIFSPFSALSPGGLGSNASTASLTPTVASGAPVRWLEPAGGAGLALDAQEMRDLRVVSEWARPGKPMLGRILADEVEASKGRVAVACCGPTSLNALMRKLIAAQISPARVARGDLRGSIDFIAEDFEY